MSSGRFLLVATVKNEGPNILEWVAHHRLCGFDRIILCQNESTDLTVRILRVLDQMGLITFINNERWRGSPQPTAYRKASHSDAFAEAEYCLALDGDEFFRADLPGGTVVDLVAATGAPDLIHLNWQNFGSGGETRLSDRLVTERFTASADPDIVRRIPEGFKTLFRTDAFSRIGIHRPRFPKREGLRAVNGSGMESDAFRALGWRCSDPGGMRLARIHHYPIRDAASFVLKRTRGSGHQDYREVGLRYWRRFDDVRHVDATLARRAPAVWEEMRRLDAMSSGRLMHMRDKSRRLWQAEFDAQMAGTEVASLYLEIAGEQETARTAAQ